MGIERQLQKLREAVGGSGPSHDGRTAEQVWRDWTGEKPPEAIKRLFNIPIDPNEPIKGFTREELDEAGVDLGEVLKALAVAGGMVEPEEVAGGGRLSAEERSGQGALPLASRQRRCQHAVRRASGRGR